MPVEDACWPWLPRSHLLGLTHLALDPLLLTLLHFIHSFSPRRSCQAISTLPVTVDNHGSHTCHLVWVILRNSTAQLSSILALPSIFCTPSLWHNTTWSQDSPSSRQSVARAHQFEPISLAQHLPCCSPVAPPHSIPWSPLHRLQLLPTNLAEPSSPKKININFLRPAPS
jgi:hypothetical protein